VRTNRTWIWITLLSTLCSCATAPERMSAPNEFVSAASASIAPVPAADAVVDAASGAPEITDEMPCERPPRPLSDDGVFYVQSSEPASPRVRYLDGQVSLNDSCAIRRGSKLSRRVPPMYVNGKPIGFC
jgi:hypothetical protein